MKCFERGCDFHYNESIDGLIELSFHRVLKH
jgi:hypothetical protein